MEELAQSRFRAPALALVVMHCGRTLDVAVGVTREPAAQRQAFAQARCHRQLRFLLHEHDAQTILPLNLAVVELRALREHGEER